MVLRPHGPKLTFLLEESVLRRPGASPEVMREQLAHLADLARNNPKVTIRGVPVDARLDDYVVPLGPFNLYSYPDPADPDAVFCEGIFDDRVFRA